MSSHVGSFSRHLIQIFQLRIIAIKACVDQQILSNMLKTAFQSGHWPWGSHR